MLGLLVHVGEGGELPESAPEDAGVGYLGVLDGEVARVAGCKGDVVAGPEPEPEGRVGDGGEAGSEGHDEHSLLGDLHVG